MFFDIISALCKKKGISIYKAATDIGLNRAAATKWKNGAIPSGVTLTKLSDYFGVTTDYLLGAETEKAPTPEGERQPDINQAKIALFGGDGEVTDEMWEEAIFAAQLIKERHKRKKGN